MSTDLDPQKTVRLLLIDILAALPRSVWIVLLLLIVSGWPVHYFIYEAKEVGVLPDTRALQHRAIGTAIKEQTQVARETLQLLGQNQILLGRSVEIMDRNARQDLGDCINRWSVHRGLTVPLRHLYIERCYGEMIESEPGIPKK